MDFKPRAVPRSHVKYWLVDAIELSKRRIVWFVVLALGAVGLVLFDPSRLLFHSTFPLFIAMGCIIALSADLSVPVLDALQRVSGRVWVRIFLASAVPWLAIAVFGYLIELTTPAEPGVSGTPADIAEKIKAFPIFWLNVLTAIGAALLFIAATYLARFLWFVAPLLSVAEMPLSEAVIQSFDALKLNNYVTWVFAGFLLWLILCGFVWVLFFPWLAVATATMYVSFRDIWLGNFRNEEVKQLAVVESGAVVYANCLRELSTRIVYANTRVV